MHVLLVNYAMGRSHQIHAVSGISTKLYGQATLDQVRGACVFKMSMEDYERDKLDLIGNTQPGQQWIPEFISETEPDATPSEVSLISDLLDEALVPPDKSLLERVRMVVGVATKKIEDSRTFKFGEHVITQEDHGLILNIDGMRIFVDMIDYLKKPSPEGRWYRIGEIKDGMPLFTTIYIDPYDKTLWEKLKKLGKARGVYTPHMKREELVEALKAKKVDNAEQPAQTTGNDAAGSGS